MRFFVTAEGHKELKKLWQASWEMSNEPAEEIKNEVAPICCAKTPNITESTADIQGDFLG